MTEEITAPAEPIDAPAEPVAEAAPPEPAGETPTAREAIERAFSALDESDTDQKPAEEKPRGPDGKFVAKEAAEAPAPKTEPAKAEDLKPEKAPISDAPKRFSEDARAAWADAPEAVRGEINRAIAELESGLAKKDEVIRPLEPFMQMAQQHGTTIQDALRKYTAMEGVLAKDPVAGLTAIAQNMGMTLQDLVGKVTGQAPEAAANAKDQQIVSLTSKINQLEQQLGTVNQTVNQSREEAILGQINDFSKDKPRFDELAPTIAQVLKSGLASDLPQAYVMAERLNPAPAPQPAAIPAPAEPPATAQTRPAKSVTGAPGTGSNPAIRTASRTVSEATRRAFGEVGL